TAANLAAIEQARHGFFTREGGVSAGIYASLNCGFSNDDDDGLVSANRAIAMDRLGLPASSLTTVKQVHGMAVHLVTEAMPGPPSVEADALVTDRPGIALGVLSADCAPLLLVDPDAGVIGAAHAGWRGALLGVADRLVEAMVGLGADTARMVGAVGPCIAKASYQVGPDMRADFERVDPEALNLFEPDSDREPGAGSAAGLRFDLKAYVLSRLARLGVENREVLSEDTHADEDRFFSARRSRNRGDAGFGLLLSAIALDEQDGGAGR
ncbi:MAG: polyphenol oxidase family protein, partial [Pseudomonadota bacterium]